MLLHDGFAPHPNVLVESTSLLAAMDCDDFKRDQGWIDQYWQEADEVIRIRNEEVRNRRAGIKQKRTGGVKGVGQKRLKVSNNHLGFAGY